jgi:hypothetical protein
MPNRRIPDRTGLLNHTVMFMPESAKREDTYRNSLSTDTTLVIDYELLAGLPLDAEKEVVSQPPPIPPVAPAQEQRAKTGESTKKDPELEALRKELEDIKRQLADQDAKRQPTPSKPSSGAPKSP